MEDRLQGIIEALEELLGDHTVPRNIKARVDNILKTLREENGEEMSIKINKALSDLDEISDDANIQPDTRTQIWNISSMLEMM